MKFISSCSVDNFTAGDSIGEGAGPSSPTTGVPESSHSFFNIAFREALKKKVNIHTVFEIVTRSEQIFVIKYISRYHFSVGSMQSSLTAV